MLSKENKELLDIFYRNINFQKHLKSIFKYRIDFSEPLGEVGEERRGFIRSSAGRRRQESSNAEDERALFGTRVAQEQGSQQTERDRSELDKTNDE